MKDEGVIFMEGRGGKDRVEVQGSDSEVLEVIELVDHTLKIAPVAPVVQAAVDVRSQIAFPTLHGVPFFRPRRDPPFGSDMIRYPTIFGGRVVLGISVAEPLRKDLVPDGLLCPVRG